MHLKIGYERTYSFAHPAPIILVVGVWTNAIPGTAGQ